MFYDPEALSNTTAETLKAFIEETYKDIKAKGVTHSIEIEDGKVVQDAEVDLRCKS